MGEIALLESKATVGFIYNEKTTLLIVRLLDLELFARSKLALRATCFSSPKSKLVSSHPIPISKGCGWPTIAIEISYTVLIGPEWSQKAEDQALTRIRRIGHKDQKTYTYRLMCEDVKIEKGIANRHELRQEFEGMATRIKR